MRVVTAAEMRAIEERACRELGLSPLLLMENAGRSVAALAWAVLTGQGAGVTAGGPHPWRLVPVAVPGGVQAGSRPAGRGGRRLVPPGRPPRVGVVAGKGNNGGDALCAARHLVEWGAQVTVQLWADPDQLTPEGRIQLRALKGQGVPVAVLTEDAQGHPGAAEALAATDLVVDGLLGTGVRGAPRGLAAAAIAAIRRAGRPVLSIDLPSGVETDTGQAAGAAVQATWTLALGLPKLCHFLYPGAGLAGEVWVAAIGLPGGGEEAGTWRAVTPAVAAGWLPVPAPDIHKGRRGRVLVVGGSRSMPGAVALAALAALRAGAGLVHAAVPEPAGDLVAAHAPEIITWRLPAADDGLAPAAAAEVCRLAAQAGALALGPGVGTSPGAAAAVRAVVAGAPCPVVLDADGIRAFAGQPEVLREAPVPVVLTPHPGEAAALLGTSVAAVQADRPAALKELVARTGQVVLLKGPFTLVGAPGGAGYVNLSGGPALATAGSGDVLTGTVAALMAQGLAPVAAAALGAWLHGRAGDHLAARRGSDGILAGDIAAALPGARRELSRYKEAGGVWR